MRSYDGKTAYAFRVLVLVTVLAAATDVTYGQVEDGNTIGGLDSKITVFPRRDRRELQGPDAEISTAAPESSVASFVDSINTNDAAFSVVVGQSRLLTLKQKISDEAGRSVIAIGDPSVADFQT